MWSDRPLRDFYAREGIISQDDNPLIRALLSRQPNSSPTLLGSLISSRSRWSSRFDTWADPLSDTADQKCQNAESVIRAALSADSTVSRIDTSVFAQGSYRANTNVKSDSDVDICARNNDVFYFDVPTGVTPAQVGIYTVGGGMNFTDYKNQIGNALYNRFTYSGVQRGDKAFRVHANTYRIEADVVPSFNYRLYRQQGSSFIYTSGICFYTDSGKRIVNFPDQTLANGRAKNESTGRRYKKIVRILKGLRYEMEDKGIASAKKIASFQIACLAYNSPNSYFGSDDLYGDVEQVARHIWYSTQEFSRCGSWKEIDEIKDLFPMDNLTLRGNANEFFWDLMKYTGIVGGS